MEHLLKERAVGIPDEIFVEDNKLLLHPGDCRSSEFVVSGQPNDDTFATEAGAVNVIYYDPATGDPILNTQVFDENAVESGKFNRYGSIAMSRDGLVLVIGDYEDSNSDSQYQGSIKTYTRPSINDSFSLQYTTYPPTDIYDTYNDNKRGYRLGKIISMTPDGLNLVSTTTKQGDSTQNFIYVLSRVSRDNDWDIERVQLSDINDTLDSGNIIDYPHISNDGLQLNLLVSTINGDDKGGVVVLSRANISSAWVETEVISGIYTSDESSDKPTTAIISGNRLVMVIARKNARSERNGNTNPYGAIEFWQRVSTDEAFTKVDSLIPIDMSNRTTNLVDSIRLVSDTNGMISVLCSSSYKRYGSDRIGGGSIHTFYYDATELNIAGLDTTLTISKREIPNPSNATSENRRYGYNLSTSQNGLWLTETEYSYNSGKGRVNVYSRPNLDSNWSLNAHVNNPTDNKDHATGLWGVAISNSGLSLMITLDDNDDTESQQGVIYSYYRSGTGDSFSNYRKVLATNPAEGARFGYSIVLSADSLTAIVTASYTANKGFYNLTRETEDGVWSVSNVSFESTGLTLAGDDSDFRAGGMFTHLSADGLTLQLQDSYRKINDTLNSCLYIFKRDTLTAEWKSTDIINNPKTTETRGDDAYLSNNGKILLINNRGLSFVYDRDKHNSLGAVNVYYRKELDQPFVLADTLYATNAKYSGNSNYFSPRLAIVDDTDTTLSVMLANPSKNIGDDRRVGILERLDISYDFGTKNNEEAEVADNTNEEEDNSKLVEEIKRIITEIVTDSGNSTKEYIALQDYATNGEVSTVKEALEQKIADIITIDEADDKHTIAEKVQEMLAVLSQDGNLEKILEKINKEVQDRITAVTSVEERVATTEAAITLLNGLPSDVGSVDNKIQELKKALEQQIASTANSGSEGLGALKAEMETFIAQKIADFDQSVADQLSAKVDREELKTVFNNAIGLITPASNDNGEGDTTSS